MTRFRRAVFWTCVALYAVALPVLLVFAFGLQVEPHPAVPVVESSTLAVSTVPAGASVSVAGQPPRPSPAVFDGLRSGPVDLTVSAPGARTWKGTVRAQPGLALSIDGLGIVPADAPRELISLPAGSAPVAIAGGRVFAYVPPGERALMLAVLRRDGVMLERVPVPGVPATEPLRPRYIEMSGHLAVELGGGAEVWLLDAREPRLALLPAPREGSVLRLPPSTVELLWASADGKGAIVAEEGCVRRVSARGSTSMLRFAGALVARGYAAGRWHFLDDGGALYQYGGPIPPSRVSRFDLRSCSECRAGADLRILAATDHAVACLDAGRRLLLVLRTGAEPERLEGVDGGSAATGSPGAWLWRGEELLLLDPGGTPRPVAAFGAPIRRVQEEFREGHLAVETAGGVYLLPAQAASERWIAYEPMLIMEERPGMHVTACGDGILLAEAGEGYVKAYRLEWSGE